MTTASFTLERMAAVLNNDNPHEGHGIVDILIVVVFILLIALIRQLGIGR